MGDRIRSMDGRSRLRELVVAMDKQAIAFAERIGDRI
jgi:hypothetical protein